MIAKIAGITAVLHIACFPLLDVHFRERVQSDIIFAVQAYKMGYYSTIFCSPGQDNDDRPHSPYHQNTVACHSFTAGGKGKRLTVAGDCCDGSNGNDIGTDGVPPPGSALAARKGQFWDYTIAKAQRQNPARFVPGAARRFG